MCTGPKATELLTLLRVDAVACYADEPHVKDDPVGNEGDPDGGISGKDVSESLCVCRCSVCVAGLGGCGRAHESRTHLQHARAISLAFSTASICHMVAADVLSREMKSVQGLVDKHARKQADALVQDKGIEMMKS